MQQYLSVTRDIDGESGIVSLRGQDILFLEWSGKDDRVIVHTMDEKFYVTGTLKYWSNALNNSGFTFRDVDRNNLVNVDRIVRIDSVFKIAYFESEVRSNSKHCTMSIKKYRKFEQEFLSDNSQMVMI